MPEKEDEAPAPAEGGEEMAMEIPLAHPGIGIIYPPPEVRNIVDKTASFVARVGAAFESKIREKELGNPKFNFLNSGDPYHAYYQHKVKECGAELGSEPAIAAAVKGVTPSAHQKQQELLKQVEQPFVPKDPPAEFEFIADPPSISALDLDIVKLTAQFVARNGRQFLTNLMNREQKNFQFDFLRPQHSLFQYFTKLLEQYTKVLIPPKDLMTRLKDESINMDIVMEKVKYRAEYFKYQEAQKQKEEEELERERVAYAQIDWHDFVVVETVDYQPFEVGNFPAPTTPMEVGARVLMQERIEEEDEEEGDADMQIESDGDAEMLDRTKEDRAKDNNDVQDMEQDSDDEEEMLLAEKAKEKSKEAMQPPPLPPTPGTVLVKKGYDPKQKSVKAHATGAQDDFLISPITGEKIPANKVQEHMRIGLLDPRWVEQRDKHLNKLTQDAVFAPGTAIESSLKQLAERRTDIFGVGDEETAIGKKIGEEEKKKDDKVTWDGHTSSVEAATRAARANITLEEQIHQIHKVKGLLPDEEKEKIGPKPASSRESELSRMAAAASKPQATLKAPPKPASKLPQQQQQQQQMSMLPPPSVVAAQQQQQQQMGGHQQGAGPPGPMGMGMPPMGVPQPMMPPQPAMMMMAPMPPMRPPPLMTPAMPFVPPPPPPSSMQASMGMGPPPSLDMSGDEPPMKKLRTEDSLIPAQQFIDSHPGPVMLNIKVPHAADKTDWQLNGQTLKVTLQLTDRVSALKEKICELVKMPPSRQKLQHEGMFFKDNNVLGFYNLTSGSIVTLMQKERGGRKK